MLVLWPNRLLKKAANEAAGERKPEAYPLGYVEDFVEPRTKRSGRSASWRAGVGGWNRRAFSAA